MHQPILVISLCLWTIVIGQNSPWLGQPWGNWLPNASASWLFPNPDVARPNVSVTDRVWLRNQCLLSFGGGSNTTQMLQIYAATTAASNTTTNATATQQSYMIKGQFMSSFSDVSNASTLTPILNLSSSYGGNSTPNGGGGGTPRIACAPNIVATAVGDQIVLVYTSGPLGLPTSVVAYTEVFLNFATPTSGASNYTVGMNAYPCTWYGCRLGWFNPPYTFTNVVLCTQCSSPWWGSATIAGTDLLVEFSFQLARTSDGAAVPLAMIPFLAAVNARVCNATGSYAACNATLLGASVYLQVLSVLVTAQPALVGVVGSSMTTDSAMQYLSWTSYTAATPAMWGVCSAARASTAPSTPWVSNCAMEPDSVYWSSYTVGTPFPYWQCYDATGYASSNFLGPIVVQAGRRSVYYRKNQLLARDSYGLLTNAAGWNNSVATVMTYGVARAACDIWSPYACDSSATTSYLMSHSLMMAGAASADGTLFYAMADVYAPPSIAVFSTLTMQLQFTQSIMPLGSAGPDPNQFDNMPIAFLSVDGSVMSQGKSPIYSGNVGGIYATYPLGTGTAGMNWATDYEGKSACFTSAGPGPYWTWRCLSLPNSCSGITTQCFSNSGWYQCQGQAMLYWQNSFVSVGSGGNIGWASQYVMQKCSASYNQPFYHSVFMTHPTQLGVVYMLTPPRTLHPQMSTYIAENNAWTNGQTVQYFVANFLAPGAPTSVPVTTVPTFQPEPTPEPSVGPTYAPFAPIARPTYEPFAAPSMYPTYSPSRAPTLQPTPVNYTLPPSPGPFETVPVTCGNFDVFGVAADFSLDEAACPFRGSCLFNASYTCPPGLYDMKLGPNGRACGGYLRYCVASETELYFGATFGVAQPSYCQYMCDVDDPTRCTAQFSVPANWNLPYVQAGLTSSSYAGLSGATTQLTFDNVRTDSFIVDQSGAYSDCWRSGGVLYASGSQCMVGSCLLFNSGASPLDTVSSTTLVQCARNDGLPRGNASFTVSFWFRYQNLTSPNGTMVQFTRYSRYAGPVTNASAAGPDYLVVRDLGSFYERYIADYTQAGTSVAVSNSTQNSTCNVTWAMVLNPAAANLNMYPPPNSCRNSAGVSVACYVNATIFANVSNCVNATGAQPFNITTNATFRIVTTTGVVSLGAVAGGYNPEDVLGEWHHYTLTYDGSTNLTRRYLDGDPALVNFSTTQVQGPIPSFPNFGPDVMLVLGNDGLGAWNGGFQGYMDEFIVFNRTLNDTEVRRLYTWPSVAAPPPPPPPPDATLTSHQGPACIALCGGGVQSCTFGYNATNVTRSACNCAPTSVSVGGGGGVVCQAQGTPYGQCTPNQMLQYCGVESALACRTRTFWLAPQAASYVSAYIDTSVVNYASANTLAGAASVFVYNSTSSPGLITDVVLGAQGTTAVAMPECLCTGGPSGAPAATGWRSVVAPNSVVSATYSYGIYRARTWLCVVQDQATAAAISMLDDAPPVTAAGYCNGVGAITRKFNLQIPHAKPPVYGQLYAYADTRNLMWDTWAEQQQETAAANTADLAFNLTVGILNPSFFYDSFVAVLASTGVVLALGAASAASVIASSGASALMLPTNPYNCEFYFLQAYCGLASHQIAYPGTGYCLNPRLSSTVYYGFQTIVHPVLQCYNLHNALNSTANPVPAVWFCNNYTIGCVNVTSTGGFPARQRWQTPGYVQATNNGSSAANRYSPCDCYTGWTGYSCTVRNCAPSAPCSIGFADTNCTADGGQCALGANLTMRTGCVNGVYVWSAGGCACDTGWALNTTAGALPRCTVPLCNATFNATCVANGGTCTGPGVCTCAFGRFGPTCDSCFQLPNGVIGGPLCSVPTRNPPCQNNGTAGFEPNSFDLWCDCSPGWGGDDCSIPMCSVVNGSMCSGVGVCTRPAAAFSNNVSYGPQSPVAPHSCMHSGAYGSCPQALGCVRSTQIVNGNYVIDYTRGGCACQLSAADYCVQPGSNGAICSNRLDANGCSLCKTRDIFGSSGPLQEMYCDCRDGFSGTYCEVNPCVQPGSNRECSGLASCNWNCSCPLQTFDISAALGVGQYCEVPVPACDFVTLGGSHLMCNDATGLVNRCVRNGPADNSSSYSCVCGNGYSPATKCAYPSTASPTPAPSRAPTSRPSSQPSIAPSALPTSAPSRVPTTQPTAEPTALPTTQPSAFPTPAPTKSCPTDASGVQCGQYFPLDGGWVNNMTGNTKHTCINGQCVCNTIYRLNYTNGLCDFVCNPATTLSYFSIQGLQYPCVCIATHSIESNCWNTVCPNTTYMALNGTCQAYPTSAPSAAPSVRPSSEPSARPTTSAPSARPTVAQATDSTATASSTTILIAVPAALAAAVVIGLCVLCYFGKLHCCRCFNRGYAKVPLDALPTIATTTAGAATGSG